MFVLQAGLVKGRGGITTAMIHYGRMLRAVGVPSAAAFHGPAHAALKADGIDVLNIPSLLKSPLGRLPLALKGFQRTVRSRVAGRPLLIVVHSDLALPALRRLFPRAVMVTPCHSDKFTRKKSSDLIVTLNPRQDDLVRKALPRARIALLGNPYVGKSIVVSSSAGPPRLNFVGRFVPDKGPHTLVKAASLINGYAGLEVRFIGAGELEGSLRNAAAAESVNITFAGWMSEPFGAFHRNDILVSCSLWEALPYLLHEALDNGVPVVASDIPGNRAALGGGRFGLLFPPGDTIALAKAIESALGNLDMLRSRAKLGGREVVARYGAHRFWSALTAALFAAPMAPLAVVPSEHPTCVRSW